MASRNKECIITYNLDKDVGWHAEVFRNRRQLAAAVQEPLLQQRLAQRTILRGE